MIPAWVDRREYPFAPKALEVGGGTMRYVDEGQGRPVVMVHALNDRLIPMHAARELFSRFPEPKLMLQARGGHNRAGLSGLDDLGQLSASLARFWPTAGRDERGDIR